jgi:hypothetical protein
MISQNELKQLFDYNSETGVFTWLKDNYSKKLIGVKSGSLHKDGYIRIIINRKSYLAHRLAWLYVYGEWPKNQIDHINGIRSDNIINNLRDVTSSENNLNRSCHRLGKLIGCHYCKREQKWVSQITINNKQKKLGYFNTELEAHNNTKKFKEMK